jgi:hypothetical protein
MAALTPHYGRNCSRLQTPPVSLAHGPLFTCVSHGNSAVYSAQYVRFMLDTDVLPSLAKSRERMSSLSPPEPEHVIRKCTCRSSLVCFLSLVSKATIESGSRYTNPIGRIREGMSCVATSCSAAVQLFTGTTETNVDTHPLTQLSCIVLGRGHACRGALLLCIIDLAFW